MEKLTFQILSFFYTACLLLVLFLLYNYIYETNHNLEKDQIMQKTQQVVQHVDETLAQLFSVAEELADKLDSGQLPRAQITSQLDQIMEQTPQLFGIGVAYIPYLNTPKERRHSLYYINKLGPFQTVDEQDIFQIFKIPACFYTEPKTQHTLSNCMVFVEYSLKELKALIDPIENGKTGYSFLLSKQGDYIVHPLYTHQSIFNIADIQNNLAFKNIGDLAVNSQSGTIEYIDKITGQNNWIFYQIIPATGWLMGLIVSKNEIQNSKALQHKQIWIVFWLIILFILFTALLFRAYRGNWWPVVFSSILLFSLGIVFIWSLAQTTPETENAIMVDKSSLHNFLAKKDPIFVPTQVFIKSIEFSEENNVILTGYIQQKYDDEMDYSHNITVESLNMTKVSHHQENGTNIIRWDFEGTLPQHFNYSKYPFDQREINLKINHKDAILIPDFEAYSQINPIALPGVKHDLVLPGWNIQRSFFSYPLKTSQLNFTVSIERNLLNPFLNSLLPLIVVSLMLFAILLLLGKVKSIANVNAPLAALFFGTILAHIGLRREISVLEFLYVEYFYIIIYLAILAVVMSYVLFHRKNKLQYHHGLVAKLLFWPLIFGSLLSITVWTFY